jgi:Uma2 family endonuclease
VVIEVSDTTLSYDRNVKLPLYARAGVPEAWIVDLAGERVEVHSEPGPGDYRTTGSFGPGEMIVSSTAGGISLPVDEVLG